MSMSMEKLLASREKHRAGYTCDWTHRVSLDDHSYCRPDAL